MADDDTRWDNQTVTDSKLNALAFFAFTNLAAFPATDMEIGAKGIAEDTGAMYQNTGTFAVPVWSELTVELPEFTRGLLGTETDGSVVLSANTDFGTSTNKNYINFELEVGNTLTWDVGFVLTIRASGTITVDGTIDGTANRSTGGIDNQSFYMEVGHWNITIPSNNLHGSGGGFGGQGGNGEATYTRGDVGDLVQVQNILSADPINIQSSNGGQRTNNNAGGVGGGSVFIYASTIAGTGTVDVTGGKGENSASSISAGGGGSGGLLIVYTENTTSALVLIADGGEGGDNTNVGKCGGGGGGGILYTWIVSGGTDNMTRSVALGIHGASTGTHGTDGFIGRTDSKILHKAEKIT